MSSADANIVVTLPASLVALFPGARRSVPLPAATVADAIAALDALWPGMRDRLCEPGPRLRRHIKLFVDGDRADLHAPLRPGAELAILTAISGG